jgi:hypothetical protein
MFDLVIIDKLLYPGAVVLGILFLSVCGMLGWSWNVYHRSQLYRRIFLGGAAVLVVVFFAAMVFSPVPDHDEVEHANAAWQMSKGLLPYKDFFQHHSPMLWILLSPLFKNPYIADYPIESIRLVSTVMGLCVLSLLALMAKHVWKDARVVWIAVLFFMGYFIQLELYNLRPDLLANICNLSAFFLIMRSRKINAYGLAGFLLGFSLSLSPKYWPYMLLMPVLMVVHYRDLSFYFRALLAHAAGICIGLLPLFVWLGVHHLWGPFYQWVIKFNASRLVNGVFLFGGQFQLIPTGFALWGCWSLLKSKDGEEAYHGRLLCIMMVLSALIYLKPSKYHNRYYDQMYILSAVLAASGPFLLLQKKWFSTRHAGLAFLLVGVVLWDGVYSTQNHLRHRDYARGVEFIQTLRRIAGRDEVVCVAPDHPITSRNAVYISTRWQYRAWLSNPACRERLRSVVRDIQAKNPAIIINKPSSGQEIPGFVEHLRNQEILSKDEADALRNYLDAHYRLTLIQTREYWIRNDRYAACF